MNPQLNIEITIAIDGDVIAKRSAESFEIAEQNLGSLERWYKLEQDKQEREAELAEEEKEEN